MLPILFALTFTFGREVWCGNENGFSETLHMKIADF